MSDPAQTSTPPADPSVQSDPVELSTPYTLARALIARRKEYVRPSSVKVKIGTWNVAACPGTDKDLATWFLDNEGIDKDLNALDLSQATAVQKSRRQNARKSAEVGLYVLGLQEVVDLNMTKEYMARTIYTDNTATLKWQAAIEAALPKGYQLVVANQMFGILLLIYASADIAPTITNVSTKQVGTGLGGWFANKGAISTRLVLGETTSLVFLNCHLASGPTAANLERRCADAAQILSKTQFDPVVTSGVKEDVGDNIGDEDFVFWFGDLNYRLEGLPGDDIRRILTLHARGEYGQTDDREDISAPEDEGIIIIGGSDTEDDTATVSSAQPSRNPSFEMSPSLPDPDDFPEDPSQDPTSLQATLNSLLPHDQLAKMIRTKKAFHEGWREGPISFLPTYKYDLGTVGMFDTSEKQRAPSWCDRVLYRTRRDKEAYDKRAAEEKAVEQKDAEMKLRGIEEDDDVLFTYDPDADGEDPPNEVEEDPAPIIKSPIGEYDEYDEYDENEDGESSEPTDPINLEFYTSHQRITSSDHKPVSASFSIQYDAVVPELKAFIHSEVARDLDRAENEGRPSITVVAETGQDSGENVVEMGDIQFLDSKTRYMTIANTGGVPATFSFVDNPHGEDENTENAPKASSKWLTTSFARSDHTGHADTTGGPLGKSVTLEPGETIFAILTIYVKSNSTVRNLNSGKATLEEVLIMRVVDGRDHFVTVRGDWLPSCFGRSVDELIRVPDGGIRNFVKEWNIKGSIPSDAEQKFSAPKELFNIIAAMESLAERVIADEAMLEDMKIPKDPGWPLDPLTWTASPLELEPLLAALAEALDTDKTLLHAFPIETPSSYKLEALSSILVRFISSLTDGLVPNFLWIGLALIVPPTLPPKISDIKTKILDSLTSSPTHNISFVFLTTALARISAELNPVNKSQPPANSLQRRFSLRKQPSTAVIAGQEARRKRRAAERRFAEILAPRVCRTGMDSKQKDKATRDKERIMLEACIRPDDESG